MAPDYDLSNLPAAKVDLWIYLQVDAIFGQIMADQAERLGFPTVLGNCIVSAMTSKPQGMLNIDDGERTYRRPPPKTRRI
jgi:selenophosphate synthetase-related protein